MTHIIPAGVGTATSGGLTVLVAASEGADLSGIALIIVALGSLITAVGGVVVAIMVNRVHREVKTMNAGTVGSFAAEDETRRVEAIPRASRTRTEQVHLDEAPEKEPPQGPGR